MTRDVIVRHIATPLAQAWRKRIGKRGQLDDMLPTRLLSGLRNPGPATEFSRLHMGQHIGLDRQILDDHAPAESFGIALRASAWSS